MFSDIENHWAKECIIKLAEKSLVNGVAVFWMESRMGRTNIQLSYNTTCEPPYN